MVVIDATTLLLLLRPGDVGVPLDPATGKPLEMHAERVAYLVQRLDKAKTRIGIPTPVIAEAFVRAGTAASAILEYIDNNVAFKILSFDTVAAVELARMTQNSLSNRQMRIARKNPYQKIKIDRQIVAIAKANGATEIYSDDKGIVIVAKTVGIPVIKTAELSIPPAGAQLAMNFNAIEAVANDVRDEEDAFEAFAEQQSS